MKYSNFTTEDFVLDDYFRKWVNGHLPPEDTFWATWQRQHLDKDETISQAKLIVKSLEMEHQDITEKRVAEKIQQIIKLSEEKPFIKTPLIQRQWLKIAASLAIIFSCGWYFLSKIPHTSTPYEASIKTQTIPTIEKINNSAHSIKVSLSDGSFITLEPNSKLSYPETFAADKREVYLEGEGFFEISKNPNRPFLVYANELITKVLGTSFSIKAYEKGKDVVVKVFTGKVSVLSGKEKLQEANKPFSQAEGVILTANQMVVFSRNEERLTKTLVEKPVIVATKNEESINFNFENTPVSEVFKTLEKAYGVEIVYDEELLKNCQVTAPLANETLYEKLDLICKVIRANYEVVDAQLIITSKGCN